VPTINEESLGHMPARCEEELLNLQQAPFASGNFAAELDGSLVA
jgi:hypothetical protein